MAESKEELKSLLMKVTEESEKAGLKPNIQKTKIMASSPITSWQIDGETVETVADFILGGSKITADGDCSPEIKRRLLLGRKVMFILLWQEIFHVLVVTVPPNIFKRATSCHYVPNEFGGHWRTLGRCAECSVWAHSGCNPRS